MGRISSDGRKKKVMTRHTELRRALAAQGLVGYLPSLGLGGLTGILARATNLGGNETLLRVKSEEMTTAHRYHGGSRTDADLLGRRSTPLEGDRIRLLRGHIMPRLYLHIRT
jgi:hypothetical protein